MKRSRRAVVIFDGQCAFCRKGISILERLDWLGRLSYVDARDLRRVQAIHPGLDRNRLLEEMHVSLPGRNGIRHGFEAFRWLSWRLPLLWLFAPFLYLPGVPALGQKMYFWIARHRFQLLPCHGGVCKIPPGK